MNFAVLLVLIAFGSFHQAHAAQNAIVVSEQAAVRQMPDPDAKIIETRSRGDRIRVSTDQKQGWYKIRSSSGQFGWIYQQDLNFVTVDPRPETDLQNFNNPADIHQRKDFFDGPVIILKLGGLGFALISHDVNAALSLSKNYRLYAYGGGGEIAWQFAEKYRLGLRAMTYSAAATVKTWGQDYSVEHSGLPIMLGLDGTFYKSTRFGINFGMYAGLSPTHLIRVTSAKSSAPNSFVVIDRWAIPLLANLGFQLFVTNKFALISELGGFYVHTRLSKISPDFNGSGPFRQTDGQLKTIRPTHLGPMLFIGIQFAI